MAQKHIDPAAIEAEIARIRSLAPEPLRWRWRAVFGRKPPAGLSTDLLGRMIVGRLQEKAFGGLDRESLKFLDSLARHGASPRPNPRANLCAAIIREVGAAMALTPRPE